MLTRPALMLCLVAGLACGDDGGPGSVEGNYLLQTLNGEPLPYDNDGLLSPGTISDGTIVLGLGAKDRVRRIRFRRAS